MKSLCHNLPSSRNFPFWTHLLADWLAWSNLWINALVHLVSFFWLCCVEKHLCLSNVNKKVLSVLGYNANFIILTLFQDLQERAVMNLPFSSLWKKTEKTINDFNIYSICFSISFSLDPSEFTQIKIFRASSMLQWKGQKRNEFFSFPFLRTKNIKE